MKEAVAPVREEAEEEIRTLLDGAKLSGHSTSKVRVCGFLLQRN
ncbi:hypothetical protein [Methanothrix sp.]